MKRFWLVLLSLGLVAAFSTSALALDVKFSGSYYVAGAYLNKTTVTKGALGDGDGLTTAFYFQRLRLQTDFVVSPGLSAVVSADMLERVLGGGRATPGTTADALSAGTKAENQNIAIDTAAIFYATPVGQFRAGMMWGGPWGWQFGDTTTVKNRFLYWSPWFGSFSVLALWDKAVEGGYTTSTGAAVGTAIDRDMDVYGIGPIYNGKVFQAHVLFAYVNSGVTRALAPAYKQKYYQFVPALGVNLGPVRIEGEVDYFFGKNKAYDDAASGADQDIDSLAAYLGAKGTFGPAYVGGFVAYSRGQDPASTKIQQLAGGGYNWNPCLIMFNYDLFYWEGGIANISGQFINAWMYQLNGGVNIDKLSIGAALTYATRDQKGTAESNSLGVEFDVTASYKITNNLSYMLGVGYLATGDYFKGAAGSGIETRPDYLVINKLTLTF